MNLSLQRLIVSILGPCLFAFSVGYLSRAFVASYHLYLPTAINEVLKTSGLKKVLPSALPDFFSADSSANDDSPSSIQWKLYTGESVNCDLAKAPSNEKPQSDLTESSRRVVSNSQQIFVELQNLDSAFLDSEKRVETGFLTFVKRLKNDAFTYECHRGLTGKGMRCIGYAGKDVISLYTWPSLGNLSLNVRSSRNDPWRSVVPLASEIFSVPTASHELDFKEPRLFWAPKQRDIDNLSWMAYKPGKQSTTYDTNSIASYEISSDINGVNLKPVRTGQPEVTSDTRQQHYDNVYSEALVHPVMFAHENPKRIAIIGNGTGATLREVLKHKTVEKVILVGADPSLLQMNKELYPQHSDCSSIKASAQNCYDDVRVEMIAVDTMEWLRGKERTDSKVSPDEQFEVIILEKSDTLLNSTAKLKTILDSLSGMLPADGALVVPHGVLDSSIEQTLLDTFAGAGFMAIHRYEEFVQLDPLSYIVCFRHSNSRALWFATAAELHVKMQSRLIGSTSQNAPNLHWFDDATMMNYHYPSRFVEDSFCNQPETPYMCNEGHGFDPEIPNAPISSFAVGVSRIPGAGRGVFFQTDVAQGSYIAADESVYDMVVYPSTTDLFSEMIEFLDASEFLHYSSLFYTYIYGYGFAFEYFGKPGYLVDKGILTFINHGCNGTGVMGEGEPIITTEMTADPEVMPPELENYGTETHIYNPFIDRNNMKIMTAGDMTLFDIKAGTELVDNYLRYLHDGNWKQGVLDYRAQCVSSGKGVVTDYEERKSSSTSSNEEFHFHPLDHEL